MGSNSVEEDLEAAGEVRAEADAVAVPRLEVPGIARHGRRAAALGDDAQVDGEGELTRSTRGEDLAGADVASDGTTEAQVAVRRAAGVRDEALAADTMKMPNWFGGRLEAVSVTSFADTRVSPKPEISAALPVEFGFVEQ